MKKRTSHEAHVRSTGKERCFLSVLHQTYFRWYIVIAMYIKVRKYRWAIKNGQSRETDNICVLNYLSEP
jgi:hypothetical protein